MIERQILIFRSVMSCGSASGAARLLNLSQPAISQAIRKLEERADTPLFERIRGRLHPTEAAYALMSEVDHYYLGIDAIEHRLKSLKHYSGGRLVVASLPLLAAHAIPKALQHLPILEQELSVSLQVMSSKEVRQRLLARQCDMGFMADEVSCTGLEHSLFSRMSGMIALPAQHPLTRHSIITPEDLTKHPFISLNPEDTSQRQLNLLLEQANVVLSPVIETPYAFTVCELVKNGIGMGLVNPIGALDYLDRGVVLRPFSGKVWFTTYLAFAQGASAKRLVRQFISLMRQHLQAELSALGISLLEDLPPTNELTDHPT